MFRTPCLAALAAALVVFSGAAPARAQEIDTTLDADSHGWPRSIDAGEVRLTLYQPQLEDWTDLQLRARAAVSVESPGSEPVLGTVWLTARTEIDKAQGTVLLGELQFSRALFPTATDHADAWLALLREHVSDLQLLDLDRFATAVAARAAPVTSADLRDDPPRIFFQKGLAVLVSLDGPPAFRPVARTELFRAINTRSLLLKGGPDSHLFLAVSDRWLEAPRLEGPWVLRAQAPEGADEIKRSLVFTKLIDLHDQNPEVPRLLARNEAPAVLVSSDPAVVLETAPEPELVSIPGTRLSRAKDVSGDLILDPASNELYLLLGGRWFRAPVREGPWTFVPARELPDEFAKIPPTDPAGEVRPWVPGTPEALEALTLASIPETTTVRHDSSLTVAYDGEPTFEPIDGTQLRYSVNSWTPVIQAGSTFYACERAVWFQSQDARGPWTVADSIPEAFRTIPASSPVHHVSFARIFAVKPDTVVVGSTPGYLGAVVSSDGLVVWGTGYASRGWIGKKSWIPRPMTYPGPRATFAERVRQRVYDRVKSSGREPARTGAAVPTPKSQVRPKALAKPKLDLYSTPEGVVFRRGTQWETLEGTTWAHPSFAEATLESALESERRVRQLGSERAQKATAASAASTGRRH